MAANRLPAKRKSQSLAKIALTILSALVHASLRLINVDADVVRLAHAVALAPVLLLTAAVAVAMAMAVVVAVAQRQIKKTAVQLISPKTNACE